MFGLDGLIGPYESDTTADQEYLAGETFVMNGKRYKATATIVQGATIDPGTNCELCPLSLSDIQINGVSILQNGIANIPLAGTINGVNVLGVCKPGGMGIRINSSGEIYIVRATSEGIKTGTNNFNPIVPSNQHESVFYALAKLAGVDLASGSDVVGVYPQNAKTAILAMLGAVNKDALDNAGITSRTYSTKFGGEFTVANIMNIVSLLMVQNMCFQQDCGITRHKVLEIQKYLNFWEILVYIFQTHLGFLELLMTFLLLLFLI